MVFFIDFMNGETVTVIRLSAFAHLSQMQLQDNTMHDMSATDRLMCEYRRCVSTPPARSTQTEKICNCSTGYHQAQHPLTPAIHEYGWPDAKQTAAE